MTDRLGVRGLKSEDGRAEVGDGRVDLSGVRGDGFGTIRRGRCQRLQAEPCSEQPLYDVVVKVSCDPGTILDQIQPLTVSTGLREGDGDARLRGELGEHRQILGREVLLRRVAHHAQGSRGRARDEKGDGDGRSSGEMPFEGGRLGRIGVGDDACAAHRPGDQGIAIGNLRALEPIGTDSSAVSTW